MYLYWKWWVIFVFIRDYYCCVVDVKGCMFDGCVVIIYYFVNYLCIEYVGYEVDCFMGSIIYYVY